MEKYYKLVADNRKAYFNYIISDVFTAGIVLSGAEVKSLRLGQSTIRDAFGRVVNGEVFLHNMTIPTYGKGLKTSSSEESRARKLLLKRSELNKIIGRVSEKGLTLVPIKVYFSGDWAKVDMGLGKAKKTHEKRESIRQKDINRETQRILKEKG